MIRKALLLIGVALISVATLFSGELSSKKVVLSGDNCRFHAREWQLDTAVIGGSGIYAGKTGQGIGGDIGVNYFWSKYFGVGFDNSVGGHQIVGIPGSDVYDRLIGNLFIRYPICAWNLAPYAMVGGGAYWDPNITLGQGSVGGGFEYRVSSHVGFFSDCRWMYGNYNNGENSLTTARARIGVRWVF